VTSRDDEIISDFSIVVVVNKERQREYNTKIRTVRYFLIFSSGYLRGLGWAGLLKSWGKWMALLVKPWLCPYRTTVFLYRYFVQYYDPVTVLRY
jgi:hypothetical protein